MQTRPIVTSDFLKWEGLNSYPLRLVSDGDIETADIELIGEIPPNTSYGYSFRLQPGVSYQFDDIFAGSTYQAYLSDRETGDLLWANQVALNGLGVGLVAPETIQVESPTTITLVLRNQSSLDTPFAVQARADEVGVSNLAVYRLANTETGQYFYTGSEQELQAVLSALPQLRYDGPVFFAEDGPQDGLIPVYRFFDLAKGSHFYTASEEERSLLQSTAPQWHFEGPGFYVPAVASEETVPVYRLANLVTGAHLYTIVPAEKAFLLLQGNWRDEGIGFHSLASPESTSEGLSLDDLAHLAAVPLIGEDALQDGGMM